MGVGKKAQNDGYMLGLSVRIWMVLAISVTWLLFVLLFVFGILLIVGVLGNAHEEVIRFMNCDRPNSAVSCSRVYGYRSEGVVLVILSFFALGWAVVFTVGFILGFRRGPAPVNPGGMRFEPAHAHTAHFATSEA